MQNLRHQVSLFPQISIKPEFLSHNQSWTYQESLFFFPEFWTKRNRESHQVEHMCLPWTSCCRQWLCVPQCICRELLCFQGYCSRDVFEGSQPESSKYSFQICLTTKKAWNPTPSWLQLWIGLSDRGTCVTVGVWNCWWMEMAAIIRTVKLPSDLFTLNSKSCNKNFVFYVS